MPTERWGSALPDEPSRLGEIGGDEGVAADGWNGTGIRCLFSLRDGVDEAARAGVTAWRIQEALFAMERYAGGGRHGMAMVLNGIRLFKHSIAGRIEPGGETMKSWYRQRWS